MNKINFFESEMLKKFLNKDKNAFNVDIESFDLHVKNEEGKNLLTYLIHYAPMLANSPTKEQFHYLIYNSDLSSIDKEGRTAIFYLMRFCLIDDKNEFISHLSVNHEDVDYLLANTKMNIDNQTAVLRLLIYYGKIKYIQEKTLSLLLNNVLINERNAVEIISSLEINKKSFSYAWRLIENKDYFIKLVENCDIIESISGDKKSLYSNLLSSVEFSSHKEQLIINKVLPNKEKYNSSNKI